MAKKILASLLIVFSLMVTVTTTSFAQTQDPPESDPIPLYDNPFDPHSDAQVIESYREAIEADNCATPSLECLVHQVFRFAALEFVNSTLYTEFRPTTSGDAGTGTPVAQRSGVLYGAGRLIGHMYANPAANTQTYVADLLNSAHITPRAYAQGLGFASLNPILELWKAFRNVAYMFFVVIFVIIGFMIMFRQRIGGQAAITAQQAIPNIIVSLIFVTFSYAIAGFLIDLMYVLMFLIIGIFGQTLPEGSQVLIDMNFRQILGALMGVGGATGSGLSNNIDLVSNLLASLTGLDGFANDALGAIGGLTLTVVLSIAILIGTIKLFFELLKSYASIIISVVTSPIILMMGAVPGKNPIRDWLKDLIGNLLPFPVVLFVLVIFYQFQSVGIGSVGNEGGFMPPFLLGRGQSGAIASLLGLALILALPEIVKNAKKGLVKDGFGTMVFKSATDSLKEGWKGGTLIPGTGIKAPGAKVAITAPLIGTSKSRTAQKEGKPTRLGAGLVGNRYYQAKRWWTQRETAQTSEPPVQSTAQQQQPSSVPRTGRRIVDN